MAGHVMEGQKTVRVGEYMKVSRTGLEKLVQDFTQLKQSLSKVLSINGMSLLYKKIYSLEQEIWKLRKEVERKINEIEYYRKQHSLLLYDGERLREENFQLKKALNAMERERSEEYSDCLSFVSVCLTLLWRVSLNDECVTAMLSRKTIIKFLEFVTHSLESFLETNKGSAPPDNNSEEFALVLSVAGIITNIAATAMGREFLVTKEAGTSVIDALILYLSETAAQDFAQVKTLILKAMYNLSINSKGLKYLTSRKSLMTTLGLLLQDETDAELRLSLIRAIQSFVVEPDCASLAHEMMEVVSIAKLHEYADLSKGELKKATLELISDLTVVVQCQP